MGAERLKTSQAIELEKAKAELRRRFDQLLDNTHESILVAAVALPHEQLFASLFAHDTDKFNSLEDRNRTAVAKMYARSFKRVSDRCELLQEEQVCQLLACSAQELHQQAMAGAILIYTNRATGEKCYPAFQFSQGKPLPAISELVTATCTDTSNRESANMLVQHLVSKMDYAGPGEPENIVYRYELLDDEAALKIIRRDYDNMFEMGQ